MTTNHVTEAANAVLAMELDAAVADKVVDALVLVLENRDGSNRCDRLVELLLNTPRFIRGIEKILNSAHKSVPMYHRY